MYGPGLMYVVSCGVEWAPTLTVLLFMSTTGYQVSGLFLVFATEGLY